MREPAPTTVPSWITTLPPMITLGGSLTPSPRSRPGARSDCRSTRAPRKRLLERLEHPHHAQAALTARAWLAAVGDALEEVATFNSQRLLVGYVRRPDVAGAHHVLTVRLELLVEALVVDGDLALDLHVVKGRHLLRSHHRKPALFVR